MSRAKYDKVNDRLILIAGKEDTSVPTFTMAEWEAMTDAQKAEYDGKLFVISDDFNGMTVDDELSDTSVHPVQNKVITEEINDISDEISDMNNALGAKNLLPSDNVTQTINGVTFTVNADGTVNVNGTSTSSSNMFINVNATILPIKKGRYILSGCPAGGGSGKYVLMASGASGYDTGAGFELDYEEDVSKFIYIVVYAGATVSNLTFKPMLRLASIDDNTYAPYAMTNNELTSQLVSLIEDVNIAFNQSYVSTVYSKIAFRIGKKLFAQALFNIATQIPENGQLLYFTDKNGVTINLAAKRMDLKIDYLPTATTTLSRFVVKTTNNNWFYANGYPLPVGTAFVTAILELA